MTVNSPATKTPDGKKERAISSFPFPVLFPPVSNARAGLGLHPWANRTFRGGLAVPDDNRLNAPAPFPLLSIPVAQPGYAVVHVGPVSLRSDLPA
jgi:hypothetical protein